jgi:hypothetical protein
MPVRVPLSQPGWNETVLVRRLLTAFRVSGSGGSCARGEKQSDLGPDVLHDFLDAYGGIRTHCHGEEHDRRDGVRVGCGIPGIEKSIAAQYGSDGLFGLRDNP